MNTEIANAVNAAGDKAQYDIRVKRLLAQKRILAHILVKTVDEFKGMKPEDVVKYIEGDCKTDCYRMSGKVCCKPKGHLEFYQIKPQIFLLLER